MPEVNKVVLQKDQWWDILSRLIDVIHVNVFIVDNQGHVILPPDFHRYGGAFLTDKTLGFDSILGDQDFLKKFKKQGRFWETDNRYNLKMFMLPMIYDKEIVAHVIVGPVTMSKRIDHNDCTASAKKYQADPDKVVNQISEIRVVSNLMMNSILELLDEIVRNNIQVMQKSQSLKSEIDGMIHSINASVRQDEILLSLLDVALKMTGTECGSIMTFDPKTGNELTIRVAKGLDNDRIKDIRIKLGEGLTGLAAQKDEYFLIQGNAKNPDNNRIAHLLRRPEIQEALVMPLKARNKVFGVLNLHTKQGESRIQENLTNIQYLSDLVSSAF